MQSPPVARYTAIFVRDLAMNSAKLLDRSVVPKPSTERMLLSAKTCRGCRSMPKAGKWDSGPPSTSDLHPWTLGVCA
ncbi:hypothetical protein N7445_003016 [Penicillium cf. griseofulvum]|nr:hypothetical protein N7445_003016 [Penicillium cf. griseofulvum]